MENKTGKYFKYAIGEIILVVIGILIALQINNKNEQYKLDLKEQTILKELHLDFKYNKLQLDSLLYVMNKARRGHVGLLKIIQQQNINNWDDYNIENTPRDSLDYYSILSGHSWTFNPKNGTINAIINSSSLDLIKNDSLRRAVISWNDVLADYLEDENLFSKLDDDYYRWTRNNFSFTEERYNKENLKVLY